MGLCVELTRREEIALNSIAKLTVREIGRILEKDPSLEVLEACCQDSRLSVRRLAERQRMHLQAQEAEQQRLVKLLERERELWQQGFLLIAGLDEAGRGPLAGPVMAAACILPAKFELSGLNDSKMLKPGEREVLYAQIQEQALDYAVASASVEEIDSLNILQATKLAMIRSVQALKHKPHFLLIDALKLSLDIPQLGIVGGDRLSASIAAASILAKVSRDRFMLEVHEAYPEYGFDRHKGYPTPDHLQVLRRLGPCQIHRRSFAPVENSLRKLAEP